MKGGEARVGTIDGLPPLREVIATHDLRAKKQLGQNFLLDLNLTSTFLCCKHMGGAMIRRGAGGDVSEISRIRAERSGASYARRPVMSSYSVRPSP